MQHTGTTTLTTDRLMLRRYTVDDAEAVYTTWASDPEVIKYLTWPVHTDVDMTRSILKTWIGLYRNDNNYHWAIAFKDTPDDPIGDIAVVHLDEEISIAHIGYCLSRKWWHQGIMSESLKAVMDHLFDVVGVNRIEAKHDTRNENSGKVMRKCGMIHEGTLRSSGRDNMGICDEAYYAQLRDDR